MKRLHLAVVALVLVVLASASLLAQVQFTIPLRVQVSTQTDTIYFGVHPGSTDGIDNVPAFGPEFQEVPAPPLPPSFNLSTRWFGWEGRPANQLGATGLTKDYRNFVSSSQADTFNVRVQGDFVVAGTNNIVISWPANLSQFGTSWTIRSRGTGVPLALTNMLSVTSVSVPTDGATFAFNFTIIKVGANAPTPGPTFVLDQTSLNFGTIGVGAVANQTVKVSNTGSANPLNITAITAPADYSVLNGGGPLTFPVVVNPGTDKTFTVRFSPTSAGTKAGNVVFTHNAPGSPTNLAVTGAGLSQLGTLAFARSTRTLLDNTPNMMDTIGLTISGNALKGIQYTLKTQGQLILRSIQHTATPAPNWTLAYNIVRGSQNAFGATDDTVNVLFFGNGATSLPAGTYPNLFVIKYDVVNVSNAQETSNILIRNVLGSLADGSNANVSSAGDETITVKNRTGKGDINLDDHIDVLDLLMIVDHITGKSPLTGAQFTAADIYPYPGGDGAVNVQDLSLLQNVILTGMYPDGQAIAKMAPVVVAQNANSLQKLQPGMNAGVRVNISKSGIAVRLENTVAVKGLQVAFTNVHAVPKDMNVTTKLGDEAYYSLSGDVLTVLLYSKAGSLLGAGDRSVLVMPFAISNPSEVKVAGLVVADESNNAIDAAASVSSNESTEELPTEFVLTQNYPNPFNPTTDIKFSVPQTSDVKLVIYNTLGQEVKTLFAGQVEQGTVSVRWDGKDNSGNALSSGIYLYRITAGNFVQSRKMVLLK